MTKIVFMGTPDFSVPVLRDLVTSGYNVIGVVTQPDRPVGRKRLLTPPPVKVEAEKHGIPVLQPERIRNRTDLDAVLELGADLIVTAAFGQILPKELLDAPKLGCVNVHASLLPELRGGAPIHYSIMQGKKKTGITIMYMVEKLDAGDILTQVEIPIDEQDTVGSLHDKLSKAGSELLLETLPKLINGELIPIPQEDNLATFAPNIKREQEKIDWAKSGEEIYNQIRGMNPWPVSFTSFAGTPIKIWWGTKQITNKAAFPGEIISIEEDGIVVATGNQVAIKIIELQPSGKKKMLAEQLLRGATMFQVGDTFGDHQ